MHNTLMRAVDKLKRDVDICLQENQQEKERIRSTLKVVDDANQVIQSGTERVIDIVRRLRSFARLDEAELKTVDIHEGLEDTLTIIHHQIKDKIALVKDYGELPRISCFPGRLNQVFLNLLINAKQAMKDGGEIRISTKFQENHVHITIQDTGTGIPAENLARIFDPGFTTKGVGVGTGLGLSICYQIIQEHQGDILVDSQVGKGTIFTIILPTDLEARLEAENG
jgi:signal transduction histidine kinase